MSDLEHDGTRECERCGLPMTPVAEERGTVTLECANRHRHELPLPDDRAERELVRSWIRRRGAQLYVQHERWEAEEEHRRAMEKTARLIRPSDRRGQVAQTAGMRREEILHSGPLWVGVVHTEAGRSSSWHHHGTHESMLFVIAGRMKFECGPGGKTTFVAQPGDAIYVPAGEIHRESNDGVVESEAVVIRSGTGELVVNVAGPAA